MFSGKIPGRPEERVAYGGTIASFVATVKGVKLYDLGGTGVSRGERVILERRPTNAYNGNCETDARTSTNRCARARLKVDVTRRRRRKI